MARKAQRKILVMDDEPDAVEFVKAVLEEAGYAVVSAPDGEAGLRAARDQKPDLIILDVQMPGKDGFTVFADLRADAGLRRVPVVMLTGVGERLGISFSAQDMGDYLGQEPDAYVEKPVDPQVLQDTVRDLLIG
jgi:DNA-binding response OmpR family regulator